MFLSIRAILIWLSSSWLSLAICMDAMAKEDASSMDRSPLYVFSRKVVTRSDPAPMAMASYSMYVPLGSVR